MVGVDVVAESRADGGRSRCRRKTVQIGHEGYWGRSVGGVFRGDFVAEGLEVGGRDFGIGDCLR